MLRKLKQDCHLVSVDPRKLKDLDDVLIHNLIVVRAAVELHVVTVEVETILTPWHQQRHIGKMSYHVPRSIS